MKIGLFIPCYVDAVYPNVGVATYKLLKHLGLDVTYPLNQTCCGQPMANAGFEKMAVPLAEKFEDKFKEFDYVVAPSVSCAAFIKINYPRLLEGKSECTTASKCMDVVEFLHDVVKVKSLPGEFAHKVSLHNSCHGVRELAYVNWDLVLRARCMWPSSTKSGICWNSRKALRSLSQSATTSAVDLAVCSPLRKRPSRHKWGTTR